MQKSLGFDRLSVLILVLVLAFSIKLYHETTLNPTHDIEKYRGWDVDTYVNLAVNETYQPFPGEPAIERKNEGPLVFLMLYPAVILGGYNGFFLFMAFFSTLTGLLIYMLAEKIKPRSGLFAAWCWLFNPLNYRLSMDLAANMFANFFGVALVLLAVMTAREPTSIWRAEPFGGQSPPNLDDNSRLNVRYRYILLLQSSVSCFHSSPTSSGYIGLR